MRITIVKPDNLTIIDDQSQVFDLSNFYTIDNLWALQWNENNGHIEYDLSINRHHNPEFITELPGWTIPIIQEHERLTRLHNNQDSVFADRC